MASSFDAAMNDAQIEWRTKHVWTNECGSQNGKTPRWILPSCCWQEGLWPGVRHGEPNDLEAYLRKNNIQRHSAAHNLKSSWVLGANLYFAHRQDSALLAEFLAAKVDARIAAVEELELEWAAPAPFESELSVGGARRSPRRWPDVAGRGVCGAARERRTRASSDRGEVHGAFLLPMLGQKGQVRQPGPRTVLGCKDVVRRPRCELPSHVLGEREPRQQTLLGLHCRERSRTP